MIVVDASALVEYLLGGERGRRVADALLAEEDRLQVPSLVDVEVAQALRRMVRLGVVGPRRAAASVELLGDMPLTRHLAHPLLPRVWELRENLTAFDAAYVALAEALDCPLLTFDRRIAGAPGHLARVEVLA